MVTPEAISDSHLRVVFGRHVDERICACGQTFRPLRRNQLFHSQVCQRNHAHNAVRSTRRASIPTFIGVDGEGLNFTDGTHRYVMLSVGDDTLLDVNGFSHEQFFSHLYRCFEHSPHAVYVGYFLGYDFAQWLKTISEETARLLFTPALRTRYNRRGAIVDPVRVGDWELDLTAMKRFQLRPVRAKKAPWMYVCDAGSYWQSSFLATINPANWPTPICTDDEYAKLVAGKNSRADKVDRDADLAETLEAMVDYNRLENRILTQVMSELATGYRSVGVKPSRDSWFGPGGAAQAWLDTLTSSSPLQRRDVSKCITFEHWFMARHAYYGGHFETFMHGHIPGLTYESDVQSAYPNAIRSLPCLCQGMSADEAPTFAFVNVTGSDPVLGPLPHRNKDGAITFPHHVIGWYPWVEILAAQNAGLIDKLAVLNTTGIRPCGHEPPLALLTNLFALRLRVGKNSPQGKAIKLLLNSIYGKFAQSVGAAKYGNPVYAALITSACRVDMLNAIASHPRKTQDLTMIATDGIFFRSPHENLEYTPHTLGSWEATEHTQLTIMKAGVYWNDATRQAIKLGAVAKIKSRGVSGAVMAQQVPTLDAAFSSMTGEHELPEIEQTLPFSFTSPVQALQQNNWDRAGMVRYNVPRTDTAKITPKRRDLYRDSDVWRSHPGRPDFPETMGYQRDFGGYVVL